MARAKRKLDLFPVKVALILIVPSIALYLFFTIWPITFSMYIAFTDANAINIGSTQQIRKLEYEKKQMITYLEQNKQSIQNNITIVQEYIENISITMQKLKRYIQNGTPATFDTNTFEKYRQEINKNFTRMISIVNSNQTFLYRYTDFKDSLLAASKANDKFWITSESIIGFKFILTQKDIDKLRSEALPYLNESISHLNQSVQLLSVVLKDYMVFEKIAVKDINAQIEELRMHFVGLKNFHRLFGDSRFPYSIIKTLLFVATSVPIKVTFGVLLAFFFSTQLIAGRKLMRALLLVPWSLPVLLSVTTWRMLFIPGKGPMANLLTTIVTAFAPQHGSFDIFNKEWDAFAVYNIVETWLAYPFIMTVTMGAIASIPKQLIEAAYIDGAGVWTRFRKIMLPLTIRPILFAAILTTGASLQAFMVPLLINQGGPSKPIHVPGFPSSLGNSNEMMVLYGYDRAWFDQDYGLSAAAYLVIVLILLVYVVVWYKFIYQRGGAQ